MTYENAVLEIVRYTPAGSIFERRAIVEVAVEHGEDPRTVAIDVKHARND